MRETGQGKATAAVMVAGVGVLSALTIVGRGGGTLLGLDIAVGLVSCALTPMLVRWPAAGGVVLGVLAVASPAATPAATLGVLTVAQRRPFPVAVGVATVGVAAHLAQGLLQPTTGLSFGWWLVLTVIAYAALLGWGALSRARWALLESLRDRARRAEEDRDRRIVEARAMERTRIAREMHDVLAHRLTLVATYAGALEYRPDAPPEQISVAAGVVRAGVHQALEELRDVIGFLRVPDGTAGLTGSGGSGGPGDDSRPAPVLTDVPRLVAEARDAGQTVTVDDRVGDAAVPDGVGRTVYRVVQEGLTNARRHAAGQPVSVTLDGVPGAELTVEVGNPVSAAGRGWAGPPENGAGRGGAGLIGLTERVQLAGGRLEHGTTGDGFRLSARLPWPT